MKTAIVIPAYNGLNYLKANLPSVLAVRAGETIVVDDASNDGTSDYIKSTYPRIHLITNASNQRFPKSVNIGFRSTSADVVFLINQDVRPAPDLIKRTLPYFTAQPRLFAASFNESKFGWADVSFSRGLLSYTSHSASRAHTTFWASGGSSAFRKSHWDRLGGFDPVFSPGYYEDLDIGWRARKHGYQILWLPEARVDHERETSFPLTFSATYLNRVKDRNYLLCQWKNLDAANLWPHFLAITLRCLQHPGYLVPVLMANACLPHIIFYRLRNSRGLMSDSRVFAYAQN